MPAEPNLDFETGSPAPTRCTGVPVRVSDRLRFVARVLFGSVRASVRNVVLAGLLLVALVWASDETVLFAALAVVVLVFLLGVNVLAIRWVAREMIWTEVQLDLPRRRRAVAGPAPGTWATDVIPHGDRHAVLLLHFGTRRGPSPPCAPDLPAATWSYGTSQVGRRRRTVVAFEWAADSAAAEAAAARMRPPSS